MSHKKAHKAQKLIVRFSVFFVLFCGATLQGQQVLHVYLTFDTPDFNLWLAKESQTVAMLEPKSAAGFDFTPGDRLKHHLGDLTLRIRTGTSGPWKEYDTSDSRKPVEGGLQYKDGPNKYGVRKSLFYYSPADAFGYKYDPALDWTTWTSWKKADADSIGRGYNYPHVIAAYWSMYRLARNHTGLVNNHSWGLVSGPGI